MVLLVTPLCVPAGVDAARERLEPRWVLEFDAKPSSSWTEREPQRMTHMEECWAMCRRMMAQRLVIKHHVSQDNSKLIITVGANPAELRKEAVRVKLLAQSPCTVARIGKRIGAGSVGEAVGLYSLTARSIAEARLAAFLEASAASEYYGDSFQRAIDALGPRALQMTALDVTGCACIEIDTKADLEAAQQAMRPPTLQE